MRGALLFFGEGGSGFRAEQTHDEIVGVFRAAIFEGRDVNGVGVGVVEAFCDLDGGVDRVVAAHIAAEKADDDGTRIFWCAHRARLDA